MWNERVMFQYDFICTKYPLTEEWIKKVWYIYTKEYYAAIKKNEMMPFAATWMDLEIVILSEISQTETEKYCMTSLISSVQSLSHVRLFATPWTTARQASLSITNSWSLPKLRSIESVMPSNCLILCRPLLLLSVFPSIKVFVRQEAAERSYPTSKVRSGSQEELPHVQGQEWWPWEDTPCAR